jgi:hypothetical protein
MGVSAGKAGPPFLPRTGRDHIMTTSAPAEESTTRHADLADLVALLRDQQGRKVDIVATPSALRAERGRLVISGTEPILTPTGVTSTDGIYRPTATCEQGISEKLKINLPYLRKCREQALELWDVNVNGWLGKLPYDHKFLIRCFRSSGIGDTETGVARALLSDGYKRIDHLDVLTAALDGVEQAGVPIRIQGCDLTEQRMYVRVYSPAVQVLAPKLLEGYRSPFTGDEGAANPADHHPVRGVCHAPLVLVCTRASRRTGLAGPVGGTVLDAHCRALTWREVWEEYRINRNTLKSWVSRGHPSPPATPPSVRPRARAAPAGGPGRWCPRSGRAAGPAPATPRSRLCAATPVGCACRLCPSLTLTGSRGRPRPGGGRRRSAWGRGRVRRAGSPRPEHLGW